MVTTIQTREDERMVVASGERFVSVSREYLVPYSDPPRWRPDPEAGISFMREHASAIIAAMQATSEDPKR